jgi:benzoate transport
LESNVRKSLDEGAMSRFQWLAIAICVMLVMLDGFDVLVMAFTAPAVSAEWKLGGAELGVLFSAGLFGMAAGSLFLAPLADRWGRQPMILVCLMMISLGMGASSLAAGSFQLAALRAFTGLGIGGMLASVGVITAEYASNRWRSTAVGLQATGYPIGATIGGSIAALLLEHYGWRSVFVFGALATAAMIPVVLWRLPESVDFLVSRRPARAVERLNALLERMQRPAVDRLPESTQVRSVSTISSLFTGRVGGSTLLLWASFFLLMFSFYFALSWTPKLLVAAGLSAREGITGGVLLNIGGIVGGSVFGVLAARLHLGRLTAINLIATAIAVAAFGAFTSSLVPAFVIAFAIGMFIFASMAGLYAFAPVIYPAVIRTTGMGWAIGVGRIGAILAPLTAGSLLDAGWAAPQLYYAYAAPLLVATAAVLLLSRHGREALRAGAALKLSAH